ncbi:MAG: hypothetical protein R3F02_03245 [Thiolinea sp.]
MRKLHRAFIYYLLILSILMGPVLSMWTTPMLVKTAQGEQVFLCTMQGVEAVTLLPDGTITRTADDAETTDTCPALYLQALFSQSLTATLHIALIRPEFIRPDFPLVRTGLTETPLISYPARAPPLA